MDLPDAVRGIIGHHWTIFFTDYSNCRVRELRPSALGGGTVTTLAGSGKAATIDGVGPTASFAAPRGIALDPWEQYLYLLHATTP